MALVSGGRFVIPSSAYSDEGTWVGSVSPTSALSILGMNASYATIYRTQPWISAAVDKIANSAARLPVRVYRRDDKDGRDRLRDHPLNTLLHQPFPGLDSFSLWLWTVSTFELYGEAMWVKYRDPGTKIVTALVPLHPANVEIERKRDGSRVYRWRAIDKEWTDRDVVHFRNYSPDLGLRGRSRLEPLRHTLIAEDAVRRAAEAWWKNGARPSVILSHSGNVSDPAMARLRASWEHLHAGVDRWGSAAILEEGMTASVMQLTASDMQMVESRKLSREEVCAVYDIPPPVLHILDHATFSNITEQFRAMYRDTMTPRLALYESALGTQLVPEFEDPAQVYIEFDLGEVLRGDWEQRVEANRVAISSGWLKPSEVRASENLSDAGPDADQLYVNAALVPMAAQQLVAGASADGGALLASVAARLSRVRTAGEIDTTPLVRGLPDEIASRIRARIGAADPAEPIEPLRRELLAITRGR